MSTTGRPLLAAMGIWPLYSSVALADSRSYRPPAQTGDVYIVINYKKTSLRTETTNVTVSWGRYRRGGSVSPPQIPAGRALSAKGFVFHLRHTKNDSKSMTVETDGRMIQGPYQGGPPQVSGVMAITNK
jgi:hypothetical protein